MTTSAVTSKRFDLVRRLGEGGMGVVYEAFDRERGTVVALKTLRYMTAESLARFKREFRAVQGLHHPNLVSLGELVVSEGDQWCFTMELVDGCELLDHVRPTALIEEASVGASGHFVASTPTQTRPLTEIGHAPFDELRLRHALRQLAEALCALHSEGLVHRDVKSSNVRVARDGRVVLLDFGLIVETTDAGWTQQAAGTPAYMAPEQVSSARVGPEADWYAFGVVLFEALTGKLPFDGTALEVVLRKQREQSPAPSKVASGVPADLDALCVALLRFDPAARPGGGEVLRALGAGQSQVLASGSHTQAAPFVGRTAELDRLIAAFKDIQKGRPVTVVVEGESGVGKTALVQRFLQRVALESPDSVTLAGRCYERESVPYKAFDGVVDALARVLMRLGEEGARMVPTKPAPLVKVFPVLRRVQAIAEGTRGAELDVPGFDLRTRAFAALRELFTRLADRRPLVVVIDDAQWGDVDSISLLSDLLRPPEAPVFLLVLTVRATADQQVNGGDGGRLTDSLQGDVRRIEVGPLPSQDAGALAAQLLARAGMTDPDFAQWTAAQAGGHPLFIDMIMRQADRMSGDHGGDLRLEDVLWNVIRDLDASPRAVLEMVAIAAAPLAQETVRRAAMIGSDVFLKVLSVLRVAHLVQTRGARGSDRVEPYHDRVRAAVLAHLDETRRAECHRRIAVAMETSGSPDAEALVLHWSGAGDDAQTAHYALLAGDRAAEALAFERAAGYFKIALAKGSAIEPDRRVLQVKLAEVLESSGHGEASARAYLEAAEGAPPLRRIELERAAAVELIASGRVDDGVAVLRRVLAAVKVTAPRSPLTALLGLLFYSLWLRLIGLRFKARDAGQVRREDAARIDVLFSATMGYSVTDVITASCMSVRHLLAALRLGDPSRLMRAMAFESSRRSAVGRPPSRLESRLVDIATRLAEREQSAEGKAFFLSNRGVAFYLRGEWREALKMLDLALSMTPSHKHTVGWKANARVFGCWSLNLLGEHAELARRHADCLIDADRRGDLHTSVQLRAGSLAIVWLVADRPDEARREVREAIARWPSSRYLLQHWHQMFGEAEIALYEGDGARAYARVTQDTAPLKRSLLLHTHHMRAQTTFLRGRCAVASIDVQPELRAARVSEVRGLASDLEREGMPWTAPFAAILRAGAACADGDTASAASQLRRAVDFAEAARMAGYATAARYQLGQLLGGDEGRNLERQAEEAMGAQGIRVPARIAATMAPGFWRAKRESRGVGPGSAQ